MLQKQNEQTGSEKNTRRKVISVRCLWSLQSTRHPLILETWYTSKITLSPWSKICYSNKQNETFNAKQNRTKALFEKLQIIIHNVKLPKLKVLSRTSNTSKQLGFAFPLVACVGIEKSEVIEKTYYCSWGFIGWSTSTVYLQWQSMCHHTGPSKPMH